MLITLAEMIQKWKLQIRGIVHVGACELEEAQSYRECKIENVIWIEGNPDTVARMKHVHPHADLHQAVVSDKDGQDLEMMITNNLQSSSILEFGQHADFYPGIVETHRIKVKSTTLDTFFRNRETQKYNFMNMDIQGAELLALKGAKNLLQGIDYLYVEVNSAEVYKGCAQIEDIVAFLKPFGFVMVEDKWTDCKWGDALFIKTNPPSIIYEPISGENKSDNSIVGIKNVQDLKVDQNKQKTQSNVLSVLKPLLKPLRVSSVDVGVFDVKPYLDLYGCKPPEPVWNDNCNPETNGSQWFWNKIKRHVKCLANVGAGMNLEFPNDNPNREQHCFEPLPTNASILRASIPKFAKNIHIHQLGLRSVAGHTPYYQHSRSVCRRKESSCQSDQCSCRIEVEHSTLDRYVEERKLKLDFLKVDTEGSEFEVLQGGIHSLANPNQIKFVQFVYGGTYPDHKTTLSDVVKLLRSRGFLYLYLLQSNYVCQVKTLTENFKYSNYVATKEPLHLFL